jgi:hypothetical protein
MAGDWREIDRQMADDWGAQGEQGVALTRALAAQCFAYEEKPRLGGRGFKGSVGIRTSRTLI